MRKGAPVFNPKLSVVTIVYNNVSSSSTAGSKFFETLSVNTTNLSLGGTIALRYDSFPFKLINVGNFDHRQPDPANPPQQPVLFAAGSEDPILAASERLAAAAPHGEFFLIPGRNHFNAPTAGTFRTRALEFLAASR